MRLARRTPEVHSGTAITGEVRRDPMEVPPGLAELFHALFEMMHGPACDFAEGLTSRDDAEDAVQLALIDVWDTWMRRGPGAMTKPYFFSIVRNKVRDQQRRQKDERMVRLADAEAELHLQAFRASQSWLRSDTRGDPRGDVLDLAIAALPPKRREAFLLAHEHEFTYKEAGTVMRVSEETVRSHVRLATAQVRATFAKQEVRYAEKRQARLPAPAAPDATSAPDASSAPAEHTHE